MSNPFIVTGLRKLEKQSAGITKTGATPSSGRVGAPFPSHYLALSS